MGWRMRLLITVNSTMLSIILCTSSIMTTACTFSCPNNFKNHRVQLKTGDSQANIVALQDMPGHLHPSAQRCHRNLSRECPHTENNLPHVAHVAHLDNSLLRDRQLKGVEVNTPAVFVLGHGPSIPNCLTHPLRPDPPLRPARGTHGVHGQHQLLKLTVSLREHLETTTQNSCRAMQPKRQEGSGNLNMLLSCEVVFCWIGIGESTIFHRMLTSFDGFFLGLFELPICIAPQKVLTFLSSALTSTPLTSHSTAASATELAESSPRPLQERSKVFRICGGFPPKEGTGRSVGLRFSFLLRVVYGGMEGLVLVDRGAGGLWRPLYSEKFYDDMIDRLNVTVLCMETCLCRLGQKSQDLTNLIDQARCKLKGCREPPTQLCSGANLACRNMSKQPQLHRYSWHPRPPTLRPCNLQQLASVLDIQPHSGPQLSTAH